MSKQSIWALIKLGRSSQIITGKFKRSRNNYSLCTQKCLKSLYSLINLMTDLIKSCFPQIVCAFNVWCLTSGMPIAQHDAQNSELLM